MNKLIAIVLLFSTINSFCQEIVKENLGPNINTTYNESKPIISPDGKILFFARQNYPDNFKGFKDPQDIYYSIYADGAWSRAVNIGFPLNDKYPNGVNSVSTDGNHLLVINAYNQDGSVTAGASISNKSGSSWGYPKKLIIENFYNNSDFVDYYQSNKGNHLLMAIEREDGMGDQDLYVSKKIDETNWSEPINLGSDINTPEAEFSPFLAADDKTLFFASMGFKGYGSSDIYYSKRLDDTWKKWSKPQNIGPEVNSDEFEGYYSIPASGNFAYFVSTKGSVDGSKDIYKVTLPYQFRPDPVLLISGTVYNEKTKGPIEAEISFLDLPERKEIEQAVSSPERGDYKMVLPRGHIYEYLAKKEGFIGVVQYKDMSEVTEYVEIESDLALVPIEEGQKVSIHNIFFETGSDKFSQDAFLELDRFVGILKKYPKLYVEIGGHSAQEQSATENLVLSEERAQAVVTYFITQGLHPARFVVKGYGNMLPYIAREKIHFKPNTNINDRIELKILGTNWTVPVDEDSDDDGIIDEEDDCPNFAGPKETNGCPDSDGDLIIDKFDDCPRLAGVKENNGCPEITNETKEVLQAALRGIEFELASDVIRPVSYVILDKVVDVMQQNPDYKLRISGHTDDQGNDETNLILSHKRAQSTKTYLIEHGVEEDRLDAIGYGETKPVADNATAEGRAQNRRVEFEIVFADQN
ncbi:MAG: OmpA family protein, partial [Fulvivirga sp.]|uniref:OmpA family protein n=1 Tax=Fulvivirga sp. TaxID=1931237 RepID=UPI0032EAA9F4